MNQESNPSAEVNVSLQGSLETFALPDVLVLLSSTKKDGELRVTGGRVDGRIWLEKGQIVHSAMGGKEAPAVDALFELLRLPSGTFKFDADSEPQRRSEPETIDLVLADAQVRLGEWNEIARVVPHLDAVVDMAAEAPDDEVLISREHWRLLRRVAGGRSVNELMAALGTSEFDTCKEIKELVDLKLVSIDVDAKPKAKAAPAVAAAAPPSPSAKADAAPKKDEARRDDREPERRSAPKADAVTDAMKAAAEAADRAEAEAPAVGKGPSQDQFDALAALANRPAAAAKVRATTSTELGDDHPAERPTATKAAPPAPAPEEARALVAQLAALSGDDEAAVAAKVTEHLASGGELPEVTDGDEPINRGLLLKFLSSVRN